MSVKAEVPAFNTANRKIIAGREKEFLAQKPYSAYQDGYFFFSCAPINSEHREEKCGITLNKDLLYFLVNQKASGPHKWMIFDLFRKYRLK